MPDELRWNDDEAVRIQTALDVWLRKNQPLGFSPTRAEQIAFDKLLTRRSMAGARRDMAEWQAVHLEVIRIAMVWFERHQGTCESNGHTKNGTATSRARSSTPTPSRRGA